MTQKTQKNKGYAVKGGPSSLKSKFDAEQFIIMICNIISDAAVENGQL